MSAQYHGVSPEMRASTVTSMKALRDGLRDMVQRMGSSLSSVLVDNATTGNADALYLEAKRLAGMSDGEVERYADGFIREAAKSASPEYASHMDAVIRNHFNKRFRHLFRVSRLYKDFVQMGIFTREFYARAFKGYIDTSKRVDWIASWVHSTGILVDGMTEDEKSAFNRLRHACSLFSIWFSDDNFARLADPEMYTPVAWPDTHQVEDLAYTQGGRLPTLLDRINKFEREVVAPIRQRNASYVPLYGAGWTGTVRRGRRSDRK
jgi:hypothetical protein